MEFPPRSPGNRRLRMCRPLLRPRLCRSVLRSWLRLFSLCRCRRSRSTLLHARRRLLRRAQLLRMASRPLVPPPPRRLGPRPLRCGYEIIGQGSILSGGERNCPLRSQDFTTKHTEVTKVGKQMSLLCVCSVISVVNWSKIATRFAEQSAIEFPRPSLATL